MWGKFQRAVCIAVSISIGGLPFVSEMAIADALDVAAGNSFGATLGGGVSPSYNASTGAITANGQQVMTLSGANADLSAQSNAGVSKSALTSAVGTRLGDLTATGAKGGSASGAAYQTLMQSKGRAKPDLSADPLVTDSAATIRSVVQSPGYSDCKVVTSIVRAPSTQVTKSVEHICTDTQETKLNCTPDASIPGSTVTTGSVTNSGDMYAVWSSASTCSTSAAPPTIYAGAFNNQGRNCSIDAVRQPLAIDNQGHGSGSFSGTTNFNICNNQCCGTFNASYTGQGCSNGVCTVSVTFSDNGNTNGSGFFGWAPLQSTTQQITYTQPVIRGNFDEGCASEKASPSCVEQSSSCLSELAGECLITEHKYQCQEVRTVPGAERSVDTVQCPGAIACMGTSCGEKVAESNPDFGKAAASMEMLQNAAREGVDCSTGECVIFKGYSGKCRKGWFGGVNCCDAPNGASYLDYIVLAQKMNTLADKFESTKDAVGAVKGAWNDMISPATDVWNSMSSQASQAVMSARDSVLGSSSGGATASEAMSSTVSTVTAQDATTEAAKGLIDSVEQQVMKSAVTWAAEAFPEAGILSAAGEGATSIFVETAGEVALNVAGSAVASAIALVASIISIVGIIYAIYSILKLIISIAYECKKEETQAAIAATQKLCHYNGEYCDEKAFGYCLMKKRSYCCYTSMLSRIMNEQVRGQLGIGFGSAEHAECGGLKMSQFQNVDLAAIDLSEWTNSLKLAGLKTDSATDAQIKYSQDNMLSKQIMGSSNKTVAADDKFKALYGTKTNPTAVDDYRNQTGAAANAEVGKGNVPAIHGTTP